MIKSKNWSFVFKYALNGCFYAFKTQRNFKVHLTISLLVLFLAFWLKVSLIEWLFLIFAIFLGLSVEMANTAFEKTIDVITQDFNDRAKIAKDVSAGMMLLMSLGLAIVGLIILLPHLIQRLGF